MSREEIALQIALKLIDKGFYNNGAPGSTVQESGQRVAQLYNAIYQTIAIKQ